ncbi:hypothetical protein [Actinophytocola sediminis]
MADDAGDDAGDDAAEQAWDPATLNTAEGTDEDELGVDPLEKGIEPPEHWSGADRFGTTPSEQEQGEGLDRKLAAERPDVEP